MNELKRYGSGYAMKNYVGGVNMEVYRGDIFFVRKGGFNTGSEQDAGRPAVVVSNDKGNEHSPCVEVVYLTTQEKNPLPTHVDIVCRTASIALCEQVHTVYKDRLTEYVRTCTEGEMKAIDKALMISLGLGQTPEPTSSVNNAMIDDLMMKLEGAEREQDELKGKLQKAIEALNEAEDKCEELKNQPIFQPDSEEVVKLKAQIEMLEKQNERLLDRLIG